MRWWVRQTWSLCSWSLQCVDSFAIPRGQKNLFGRDDVIIGIKSPLEEADVSLGSQGNSVTEETQSSLQNPRNVGD